MPFRFSKPVLTSLLGLWLLGTMPFALAQASLAAQAPTKETLTLAITDGLLPKELRRIKVNKGDQLRWLVSSNTAGEFHLHAYRLSADLQAGQTAELAFTAFATGQFRLEWHGAAATSAPAAGHHAPPLAILEVQPR
jgi:hypothetical protein